MVRRRHLAVVAAVLVAAGVGAAAFALTRRDPRPAAWTVPAAAPGARAVLVGSRAGVSFYRVRRGRAACWAAAADDAEPDPRAALCAAAFPSKARPLLDFSRRAAVPAGSQLALVDVLEGVAADGIVRVALLGADGAAIATTPVVANVYAKQNVPGIPAQRVVALDARGRILYSECLRAGC